MALRPAALALPLLASLLCACAASTEAGPPPGTPASAPPSPPAAVEAAPAPPAASDGIDLQSLKEAGFSISLPKGAKQFSKSAVGSLTMLDYTSPLDAQNLRALEAHVALGANAGEDTLDAAVRRATTAGGEVASKQEVAPGRFLVVKKPEGESAYVFFFVKGGGSAKCNGPAKYVATLTAMCRSFEVR